MEIKPKRTLLGYLAGILGVIIVILTLTQSRGEREDEI